MRSHFNEKIAIVEAGRKLGGRSSSRISRGNKGWVLNHGSPNLNICSDKKNLMLKSYLGELIKNKFIRIDDSDVIHLKNNSETDLTNESYFLKGHNYLSTSSMSELSENIISMNNNRIKLIFTLKRK